jgi:hypothetical protein
VTLFALVVFVSSITRSPICFVALNVDDIKQAFILLDHVLDMIAVLEAQLLELVDICRAHVKHEQVLLRVQVGLQSIIKNLLGQELDNIFLLH